MNNENSETLGEKKNENIMLLCGVDVLKKRKMEKMCLFEELDVSVVVFNTLSLFMSTR